MARSWPGGARRRPSWPVSTAGRPPARQTSPLRCLRRRSARGSMPPSDLPPARSPPAATRAVFVRPSRCPALCLPPPVTPARLATAYSAPPHLPASLRSLGCPRADFVVTVVYEAFMPVSFLAAVAVPLWYAWVLWDDWWRSPIFLALLLTAPLKWVPWADMCLVWPGLI